MHYVNNFGNKLFLLSEFFLLNSGDSIETQIHEITERDHDDVQTQESQLSQGKHLHESSFTSDFLLSLSYNLSISLATFLISYSNAKVLVWVNIILLFADLQPEVGHACIGRLNMCHTCWTLYKKITRTCKTRKRRKLFFGRKLQGFSMNW